MSQVSACTLDCPDACSYVVGTGNTGEIRFAGNPKHPFTRGFICVKGSGYPANFLRRKDRITSPLLKQNGAFVKISWDEALELCSDKIQALRGEPSSMLHLHGHGVRGVLSQASSVFFDTLGAGGAYGSVCDETGIQACIKDFGLLDHNEPEDIINASKLVNWGKDFSRSSVHLAEIIRRAQKKGLKVLTITPGGDEARSFSDVIITIRPGADRFLAAAAAKVLMETGAVHQNAVDFSSNLPAFRRLVDGWSLDDLCAECEVDKKDAAVIASWYMGDDPVASVMGWGVQRHSFGGENVRFINALSMLTGHVGRKGGGAYFNIGSMRNFSPWAEPSGIVRRRFFLGNLGCEILAASPPVRFIWVDGTNIVNQVPDCRSAAAAMEQCEFTVVVDAFLNDTALRADLILPPAMMTEREEVVGSCFHNYINYSAKVCDPPGEALSDFEIISRLGRLLDPPINLPTADECLEKALDSPYIKASLEELRSRGFVKAVRPSLAFEDMVFGHPDGKYRFPEELNVESDGGPDFPFRLLSLVRRRYLHSQIPESDQSGGPPKVLISPDNQFWRNMSAGDNVLLTTPAGGLEVVLEAAQGLQPQTLIIRRGGWMKHNQNANVIISPCVSDMGDGIPYYSQKAKLEKIL